MTFWSSDATFRLKKPWDLSENLQQLTQRDFDKGTLKFFKCVCPIRDAQVWLTIWDSSSELLVNKSSICLLEIYCLPPQHSKLSILTLLRMFLVNVLVLCLSLAFPCTVACSVGWRLKTSRSARSFTTPTKSLLHIKTPFFWVLGSLIISTWISRLCVL